MLDDRGSIDFTKELLDLIDGFLAEYEANNGKLHSELERGLVISYLLGVMCCDAEAIWESLGDAAVFGSLRPRAVYEEYGCAERANIETRRAAIAAEIKRRGWLRFGD